MATKKVDEVVIRQLEAEKKAVMDAAEAFRALRVANDKGWPNSRRGQNFDKSMELSKPDELAKKKTKTEKASDFLRGYESKSMYGRAIDRDYTGLRRSFTGLPKFLGGFSDQERALQQAQQKLLAAQNKLHKTMDANFGTNVGGMANEDRSLMEAVEGFTEKRGMLFSSEPKSVVGTKDSLLTDMVKPFTSGGSDVGNIIFGRGSLTTRPGPFGIPLPSVNRENLPKKARFTPGFLHNRQGVTGIIGNVAEIFTGAMQYGAKEGSLMIGLGFFIGMAVVVAPIKIVGNILGMVFDAVKLVARAPELAVRATRFVGNAAYAAVKGAGLVAFKGLRALNKGIFALAKPTADFSLESHGVSPGDVAAATAKHAKVEAAINHDQAAFDAALAASNTASANGDTPEQIEKAGRQAGEASLKTSDDAIQNNSAAKKAANKAEKKILKNNGSPEEAKLAARKAGQDVLSKKAADETLTASAPKPAATPPVAPPPKPPKPPVAPAATPPVHQQPLQDVSDKVSEMSDDNDYGGGSFDESLEEQLAGVEREMNENLDKQTDLGEKHRQGKVTDDQFNAWQAQIEQKYTEFQNEYNSLSQEIETLNNTGTSQSQRQHINLDADIRSAGANNGVTTESSEVKIPTTQPLTTPPGVGGSRLTEGDLNHVDEHNRYQFNLHDFDENNNGDDDENNNSQQL